MRNANGTTRNITRVKSDVAGPVLFLDSSALFAGVLSGEGAARVLLRLSRERLVQLIVSEQVIAETERNLARKAPLALPYYRLALREAQLRIVKDPSAADVQRAGDLVGHPPDIPILLAAMHSRVDYLVTLNRRHFIDDPLVARRAGFMIGTPGDALSWVRARLTAAL